MKIGICGAHGTGKIVLAEKIAKSQNLPIIRECFQAVCPYRLETLSPRLLVKYQFLSYSLQLTMESLYDRFGFVVDQTLIDYAIYCLHLGTNDGYQKYAEIMQKMWDDPTRYDLVLYLPIEFELKNSDTDQEFQKDVDTSIFCALKLMSEKTDLVFYTLTGSLEERVEQFYNLL